MALEDPTQINLLKQKWSKTPTTFDLGWTSNNGIIRFGMPIKLVNPKNTREYWSDKSRATANQRTAAWVNCNSVHRNTLDKLRTAYSIVVKITRFGPVLLDDDNLSFSASAVRDGIADALGRGDGPKAGIKWKYVQEVSDRGYAVGVEIWSDKSKPVRNAG